MFMAGEENNHYAGKVVKYEDGIVLFRLDQKIGGQKAKVGQSAYRDIRMDGGYFALACGIKEDQITNGGVYKINRRHVGLLYERLQKVLDARKKNNHSRGKDLPKGEFKETGEKTDNSGEALSDDELATIFENPPSDLGTGGSSIDNLIKEDADDED